MKNRNKIFSIILIILQLLIVIQFQLGYMLYYPEPEINTDKEIYFSNEVIKINATWSFLYCDTREDSVNLVIINSDVTDGKTNLWIIQNSLFIFNCPITNGTNSYDIELNAQEILNCNSSLNQTYRIYLFFIKNSEISEISISFSIQKYVFGFESEILDYKMVYYWDNFSFSNRIINKNNSLVSYPNSYFTFSISNNSGIVFNKSYEINETNQIFFEISTIVLNDTGNYLFSYIFNENNLFYGSEFNQTIEIIKKNLFIDCINTTSTINLEEEQTIFFLEFQLVDSENNPFFIKNLRWNTSTNFLINSFNEEKDIFIFSLHYPSEIGIYFFNVSIYSNLFHISASNYSFNVIKNYINFSLDLIELIPNEFIKLELNYYSNTSFHLNSIDITLIHLQIFNVDEWAYINFDLYSRTESSLSLIIKWTKISELKNIYNNKNFLFRVNFEGNSDLFPCISSFINISYPDLLNFNLSIVEIQANSHLIINCSIIDYFQEKSYINENLEIELIGMDYFENIEGIFGNFVYNSLNYCYELKILFSDLVQKFALTNSDSIIKFKIKFENNSQLCFFNTNVIIFKYVPEIQSNIYHNSISLYSPLYFNIEILNSTFQNPIGGDSSNIVFEYNSDNFWKKIQYSSTNISKNNISVLFDWLMIKNLIETNNQFIISFRIKIFDHENALIEIIDNISLKTKHFRSLNKNIINISQNEIVLNYKLLDHNQSKLIMCDFSYRIYIFQNNVDYLIQEGKSTLINENIILKISNQNFSDLLFSPEISLFFEILEDDFYFPIFSDAQIFLFQNFTNFFIENVIFQNDILTLNYGIFNNYYSNISQIIDKSNFEIILIQNNLKSHIPLSCFILDENNTLYLNLEDYERILNVSILNITLILGDFKTESFSINLSNVLSIKNEDKNVTLTSFLISIPIISIIPIIVGFIKKKKRNVIIPLKKIKIF